ncbi:hypothetical protein PIB30_068822 [Stylosanthes scabra]|uniref:Zinc finger GRF-type domain-containing protein n=1 Tax=Stylosanthes scabra TaxID=79078 RepID=A0ABU6SPA7_9FABA|nr:hypothetical protein [Stylosanthes scabra]
MGIEDRDSRSLDGDKGFLGESCSATVGSGGTEGNTGGVSSKKMSRKFVASICSCRDYAILFQSKTSCNPNRLFFGCQHFKGANCKYFVLLDEYVACFQDNEGGNSGAAADPIEMIEKRIASLETVDG